MSNKKVKKNIAEVRNSMKLTQAEMAKKIGISRQAYINLESGKTSVINKQITKMAERCGLPEEKILFGYSVEELSSNMLHESEAHKEQLNTVIKEKDDEIEALKEKLDILTQLIFAERQTVKTQIQLVDEMKTRIAHLAQENLDLRKELRSIKGRRD
ncbi:MAG: helix-turn-helix transcriptional regulator [Bacteroidales bacterium]|nr:helix-turn-helix transcriptional regulator [Bacteroidales bacterium]